VRKYLTGMKEIIYRVWQKLCVEKTAFERVKRSQKDIMQYVIRKWTINIWTGLI
jgi:hypothetical protein